MSSFPTAAALSSPLNISLISGQILIIFLQLSTLGVGKFFHVLFLTFDLYQCNMIKNKFFSGTPARHCCSAKTTYCRGYYFE